MIALREDCLLVEDAKGGCLPCSVDHLTLEFVGHAVDSLDPEVLKQAAAAVLHYPPDTSTLGNTRGHYLAYGKATLPLIHAMQRSDAATRALLRGAIEQGDAGALPQVVAAIQACGSLGYSRDCAQRYARDAAAALEGLDDNDFVAALRGLAQYSVNRDH